MTITWEEVKMNRTRTIDIGTHSATKAAEWAKKNAVYHRVMPNGHCRLYSMTEPLIDKMYREVAGTKPS